jgi:hypothetical protein
MSSEGDYWDDDSDWQSLERTLQTIPEVSGLVVARNEGQHNTEQPTTSSNNVASSSTTPNDNSLNPLSRINTDNENSVVLRGSDDASNINGHDTINAATLASGTLMNPPITSRNARVYSHTNRGNTGQTSM